MTYYNKFYFKKNLNKMSRKYLKNIEKNYDFFYYSNFLYKYSKFISNFTLNFQLTF